MKTKKIVLAVAFLGITTLVGGDNLIKNGSFENFTIKKNKGKWKKVKLTDWEGRRAEIWTNALGKKATNGDYKIEMDVVDILPMPKGRGF